MESQYHSFWSDEALTNSIYTSQGGSTIIPFFLKTESYLTIKRTGGRNDNKDIQKTDNNQDVQKNDKEGQKREGNVKLRPSSKTANKDLENNLKVNKNKIIKKGSQRVQLAMKELKLLSLEEINNNKKYFS